MKPVQGDVIVCLAECVHVIKKQGSANAEKVGGEQVVMKNVPQDAGTIIAIQLLGLVNAMKVGGGTGVMKHVQKDV